MCARRVGLRVVCWNVVMGLYIVQVMGVAMGAHAHTLTLMLPMTGIAERT